MPLLPDPLRKLIEDGKMPSYIEEAIFSGNYTQTELAQMILSNDDVIKAMLPVGVQNMLQVYYFNLLAITFSAYQPPTFLRRLRALEKVYK